MIAECFETYMNSGIMPHFRGRHRRLSSRSPRKVHGGASGGKPSTLIEESPNGAGSSRTREPPAVVPGPPSVCMCTDRVAAAGATSALRSNQVGLAVAAIGEADEPFQETFPATDIAVLPGKIVLADELADILQARRMVQARPARGDHRFT